MSLPKGESFQVDLESNSPQWKGEANSSMSEQSQSPKADKWTTQISLLLHFWALFENVDKNRAFS